LQPTRSPWRGSSRKRFDCKGGNVRGGNFRKGPRSAYYDLVQGNGRGLFTELIVATRLLRWKEECYAIRITNLGEYVRLRATRFEHLRVYGFRCFLLKVEIRTGFSQQLTTKGQNTETNMPTKDFEVHQLFKAYRKGVISQELFARQMDELVAAGDEHGTVPNVFALRSDGLKMAQQMLGKTPQTESMVFTLPPGFGNDHENSHRGDQLIYVIEGKATCRVSGKECEIRAGDFVTIPAGAPHSLRTGAEKLFALTVFAPPEN
jgi:quercetin dioxygenase-like cupin family protein